MMKKNTATTSNTAADRLSLGDEADMNVGFGLLLDGFTARANLAEALVEPTTEMMQGERDVHAALILSLQQAVSRDDEVLGPVFASGFRFRVSVHAAKGSIDSVARVCDDLCRTSSLQLGQTEEALLDLNGALRAGKLKAAGAIGRRIAIQNEALKQLAKSAYRAVHESQQDLATRYAALWLAYTMARNSLRAAEILVEARANWLASAQAAWKRENGVNSAD